MITTFRYDLFTLHKIVGYSQASMIVSGSKDLQLSEHFAEVSVIAPEVSAAQFSTPWNVSGKEA